MKEDEARKFVSDAVDYVESMHSREVLPKERLKLAVWLRKKFDISIKDVRVNMKDGNPHLFFEYKSDNGEVKESNIDIKKWEQNFQ